MGDVKAVGKANYKGVVRKANLGEVGEANYGEVGEVFFNLTFRFELRSVWCTELKYS